MWQRLKKLVCPPQNASGGEAAHRAASVDAAPHPCYTTRDLVSRWQGDLYKTEQFAAGALPTSPIQQWMLATRSCQLDESDGKTISLGHLVYCAVVPLKLWVKEPKTNLKNAVTNVVKSKSEHACFLPASADHGVDVPLVVEMNLIYSVSLDATPTAAQKIAQLSSPFSEYVFQHLSRWFYTVGYENTTFHTPTYIEELVRHVQQPD